MLTAAAESIRLLRRHLKQSRITFGFVFRGDPRYGGSPLPLEYSVVHYAWQKYCKAAGVEATIHQLRHSRASQLLQAGVPVTTVRKQLGIAPQVGCHCCDRPLTAHVSSCSSQSHLSFSTGSIHLVDLYFRQSHAGDTLIFKPTQKGEEGV